MAGLIPRKPTVKGEPPPNSHPLTFQGIGGEESQLGGEEGGAGDVDGDEEGIEYYAYIKHVYENGITP
jgi:hypothetical protein